VIRKLSAIAEMRTASTIARGRGETVGLVPTMGALHDGHLALVREAVRSCDLVVVSIFVNPTQFGPGEDFERYPRRVERDVEALAPKGVEIVFTPSAEEMYPNGPSVTVDPGSLAARWEGEFRPGHFSGMATVVAKLLGIVRPDYAYFGEKDYQQLAIVRRMVRDLELGAEVVGCPTVRDADGLALSSRNAFLSPEEREHSLALPRALEAARMAFDAGERDGAALESVMRAAIVTRAPDAVALEYASVVDAESLEPLAHVTAGARALIAGRVGKTRLIDNCPLGEGSAEPE
jgi:pantoate--beta-alanine ligase